MINKKKITSKIIHFSERIDSYRNFAKKLKQIWTIKETLITEVVRNIGIIFTDQEKELGEIEMRECFETHGTQFL